MTAEGADAVIRLADLCSTFHLPVVTFTDQPGLLIGTRAEQRATIRHGVRAISAVYQASVPGAEIIVRRVFGVGGAGLTNRHRRRPALGLAVGRLGVAAGRGRHRGGVPG